MTRTDSRSRVDALRISVVLCTYNRARSLQTTLQSLAHQDFPSASWELILVDNNSRDNTREVALKLADELKLPLRYIFEGRQGKSFALNAGIEAARGEIIAFTDDDVVIDASWLRAMSATFDRFDCAGLGGRIRPVWSSTPPKWFADSGPYKLMQAIVYFEHGDDAKAITVPAFGANMAFRREAFQKYGLFRTDLGPKGDTHTVGEDTDLCSRVFKGGDSIVYAPGAIVDHPVEPERATKAYFLHWYFHFGRVTARKTDSGGLPVWFGVPRYLIRQLLGSTFSWTIATGASPRFFHKLNTYLLLGQTLESRALHRERALGRARAGAP